MSTPKRRDGESDNDFAVRLNRHRERARRWREANREILNQKKREFRANNAAAEVARQARWRAANPEKHYANHRRHYDARRAAALASLGDPTGCALCGLDPIPPRKDGTDARCIDHRHDNGVVRGVLCTGCNRAMEALDRRFSDPEWWEKAMRYSETGLARVDGRLVEVS